MDIGIAAAAAKQKQQATSTGGSSGSVKRKSGAHTSRVQREIQQLIRDPPFGVQAWPKDDNMFTIEAQMSGPDGSENVGDAYKDGIFLLEVILPERYPMEPPRFSGDFGIANEN
eukprot:g4190.t1